MIAYVCCCHLNTTPAYFHLLRASDCDRCESMIAADERKAFSFFTVNRDALFHLTAIISSTAFINQRLNGVKRFQRVMSVVPAVWSVLFKRIARLYEETGLGRRMRKRSYAGMACRPLRPWRLERRGESKQALPAITAGKIIKEKVFPVSVPSGKVLLRPPSSVL